MDTFLKEYNLSRASFYRIILRKGEFEGEGRGRQINFEDESVHDELFSLYKSLVKDGKTDKQNKKVLKQKYLQLCKNKKTGQNLTNFLGRLLHSFKLKLLKMKQPSELNSKHLPYLNDEAHSIKSGIQFDKKINPEFQHTNQISLQTTAKDSNQFTSSNTGYQDEKIDLEEQDTIETCEQSTAVGSNELASANNENLDDDENLSDKGDFSYELASANIENLDEDNRSYQGDLYKTNEEYEKKFSNNQNQYDFESFFELFPQKNYKFFDFDDLNSIGKFEPFS